MSRFHDDYEKISDDCIWKLAVCPKCKALLYRYQTKEGKIMCVDVLEDWTFKRWGNNNNYVYHHECGERHSNSRKPLFISFIEPTEEVKEKVTGTIQQQAVMKALTEFSKPRIRSSFKKGMLEQARKFLSGETTFKNPFSPKQAIAVLGDSITTNPKFPPKEVKKVELDLKKHVFRFKDRLNAVFVDDKTREGSIQIKIRGRESPITMKKSYWDTKETLVDILYDNEMNYIVNSDNETVIYLEA